jgi:hypothetical protein
VTPEGLKFFIIRRNPIELDAEKRLAFPFPALAAMSAFSDFAPSDRPAFLGEGLYFPCSVVFSVLNTLADSSYS